MHSYLHYREIIIFDCDRRDRPTVKMPLQSVRAPGREKISPIAPKHVFRSLFRILPFPENKWTVYLPTFMHRVYLYVRNIIYIYIYKMCTQRNHLHSIFQFSVVGPRRQWSGGCASMDLGATPPPRKAGPRELSYTIRNSWPLSGH